MKHCPDDSNGVADENETWWIENSLSIAPEISLNQLLPGENFPAPPRDLSEVSDEARASTGEAGSGIQFRTTQGKT